MKIIITEQQNEKLKKKIRLAVEKLGVEQSLEMFGKDIIKQAFIGEPYLILSGYDKIKPIESGGQTLYLDDNKNVIFTYYTQDQEENKGYYYFSFKVYKLIEQIFGDDYNFNKQLILDWLKNTFNLEGLKLTTFG
jgi:hypothetical protein